MKGRQFTYTEVTIILGCIALALVFGAWVAHEQKQAAERVVRAQADTYETELMKLAVLTDRNEADAVVNTIVTDCPKRSEYENLLVRLSTLSKKDLLTMQSLSELCGDFYAERKALMIAKFEMVFTAYRNALAVLTELNAARASTYPEDDWAALLELELERSTLLHDQGVIQDKIISLLITGSTPQSKDVVALAVDAQRIQTVLTEVDGKADALREQLAH